MKQNIDKREAIARVVKIMSKYQITVQDIVDEYNYLLTLKRKEKN